MKSRRLSLFLPIILLLCSVVPHFIYAQKRNVYIGSRDTLVITEDTYIKRLYIKTGGVLIIDSGVVLKTNLIRDFGYINPRGRILNDGYIENNGKIEAKNIKLRFNTYFINNSEISCKKMKIIPVYDVKLYGIISDLTKYNARCIFKNRGRLYTKNIKLKYLSLFLDLGYIHSHKMKNGGGLIYMYRGESDSINILKNAGFLIIDSTYAYIKYFENVWVMGRLFIHRNSDLVIDIIKFDNYSWFVSDNEQVKLNVNKKLKIKYRVFFGCLNEDRWNVNKICFIYLNEPYCVLDIKHLTENYKFFIIQNFIKE